MVSQGCSCPGEFPSPVCVVGFVCDLGRAGGHPGSLWLHPSTEVLFPGGEGSTFHLSPSGRMILESSSGFCGEQEQGRQGWRCSGA